MTSSPKLLFLMSSEPTPTGGFLSPWNLRVVPEVSRFLERKFLSDGRPRHGVFESNPMGASTLRLKTPPTMSRSQCRTFDLSLGVRFDLSVKTPTPWSVDHDKIVILSHANPKKEGLNIFLHILSWLTKRHRWPYLSRCNSLRPSWKMKGEFEDKRET